MSDIIASFAGPYKEQRTIHSNWLPVRNSDIPKPHPAEVAFKLQSFNCIVDTRYAYTAFAILVA